MLPTLYSCKTPPFKSPNRSDLLLRFLNRHQLILGLVSSANALVLPGSQRIVLQRRPSSHIRKNPTQVHSPAFPPGDTRQGFQRLDVFLLFA